MKNSNILVFLCTVGLCVTATYAQAADEDMFLGKIQTPLVQTVGQGRSALWTLPLVATEYQPAHSTPAMQAALQAQHDGRFLDAMIALDEAIKSGQAGADTRAEMNLLRSSFLLQGSQTQQALETLAPLLADPQYGADAYALTAMARLQQGEMQQALEAAQHAHGPTGDLLSNLALSYALQGLGRLAGARDEMHGFNQRAPQSAIALAREAELALTLDKIKSARTLINQAQQADAAHPYVVAVSGLVYLIEGNAAEAKAAFETALKRDPKDARALFGLGLAEIRLGNLQAGEAKLQAANEADPGNALILTYLGRVQQQLGRTEAAKASWRSAQLADPKDPIPWLYQAQMELQTNHPQEARESLRQAQARTAYRSVYRGERLLKEDEQLLQVNLAEVQRQLGLDSLAFHELSDSAGEKNSANLRSQAEILQGQRFAESARRSLLLQSLFNERPGNMPAELDVYGDGAGQTGASTPQHGAVSGLTSQQTSYNNYDELFGRRSTVEADGVQGTQNTTGEQVRAGVGNDTLGLGIAQRQFKTDGNAPFESLDNRIWQGIVQWRPTRSTQLFVSHQTFDSTHGETILPADPLGFGSYNMIEDKSNVTRLGLRHGLTDDSELRALWSYQQTDQTNNAEFISNTLPYSNMPPFFGPTLPFPQFTSYGSSGAHSAELQYRRSGADYATQWGVQQSRGQTLFWGATVVDSTQDSAQFYADWQQTLNPRWQLDAGLGWGKIDKQDNLGSNSTYLSRLLPKLGVVYTPAAATHVRLAAWQGMGANGAGDATLAPVSLAGVLLSRPGDNGKLVHGVAGGADMQLSSAWLLDGEAQRRRTELPAIDQSVYVLTWQQVDESKLALRWQPQDKPLSVSLAYDYERIQNDPLYPYLALDSVNEQSLRSQQLDLRWLAGEQWRVNLTWSHNQVDGLQNSTDPNTFMPVLLAYQDSFNQVDASVSWQFNRARDFLVVGVRNAADTSFKYMDTDPLNPRFSNGRLGYARLKLAW